eukprot:gene31639-6834_t
MALHPTLEMLKIPGNALTGAPASGLSRRPFLPPRNRFAPSHPHSSSGCGHNYALNNYTLAGNSPAARELAPSLGKSAHPSQHGGPLRGASVVAAAGTELDAPLSGEKAFVENIQDLELHVEASNSYLAYAMSVIVGRALPDVRDGLKPVHRRILYAMHDLGLVPSKPFKKCARVVGEVLGKYHPHGDMSVYDAMVRLAQPFSMRDPLTEPSVLPAKIPNLLVNGTNGIAVGGQLVVGPSMEEAYSTGSGFVTLRATVHVEDADAGSGSKKGASKKKAGSKETPSGPKKPLLVITEMPYQTNKADMVKRIAELVEEKSIEGVSDVRDESDRTGTRVVVELRRGFSPDVVLAQLFKQTKLESRFSCNMVALVGGLPRQMGLKEMLSLFLEFRCNVVERRANHQLQRAKNRLTQVVGFLTAMNKLDAVIKAIRTAPDGAAAKSALITLLEITEEQADAVLGLTLRRLTSLEKGSLETEKTDLEARIADLESLLTTPERVLDIVKKEALETSSKFGTPRRSEIMTDVPCDEEGVPEAVLMVPNRDVLLMFSSRGFIRRVLTDSYKNQVKGGKAGGAGLRREDALEQVVAAKERDTVLAITSAGSFEIGRKLGSLQAAFRQMVAAKERDTVLDIT